VIGIVFEGIADQQLQNYKKRKSQERNRLQVDEDKKGNKIYENN
jgi:steroid 5-alpha reductase family enzyme